MEISPPPLPRSLPWPTKGIRAVTFSDDAAVLGCCGGGGGGGDETRVQLRSHSPYAYATACVFCAFFFSKTCYTRALQRLHTPLLLRLIRKLEWKVGTHAWQFQTTLCDAFCATL